MPQTIDSYRLRAAECLDQARRSPAEEDTAAILEMAEEWLSLAAAGEKSAGAFGALVG